LSRLESNINLKVNTGMPQDYLTDTNLEMIAEKPLVRMSSRRKMDPSKPGNTKTLLDIPAQQKQ